MRHRGWLSLILLLWVILPVSAQKLDAVRQSHVLIKLAPLSLLDPDRTVQGAVEYWVKRRRSIQMEAGYGTFAGPAGGFGPSPWAANRIIRQKEVWRGRLEGRYYTSYFAKYPGSGTYVAVEGLYKQVNVAYLDTLMGDWSVPPAFVYAPVTRYEYALHSKIGTQVLLNYDASSTGSRVVIDFYVGPGIRYVNVVGRSAETAVLFNNPTIYERFGYSTYRPGDASWQLSISAGLKIGVSL